LKINLTDDDVVEDTEYYYLDIVSVSDGRVSIDNYDSFRVAIQDDDSKLK